MGLKTITVSRESLIHALRLDGYAIPDSAKVCLGDEYIVQEIEIVYATMPRFEVTHYCVKGYRDAQPSTKETSDWSADGNGNYSRVVDAQSDREANAIAGPVPFS